MTRLGYAWTILIVVSLALAALPTSARVDSGSDLQLVSSGQDGLAAPPMKCERSRDRCFPSNRSGCTKIC